MKPLLLEFQAFGPYMSKQSVDFDKLSDAGIFLIKGNTGSGKTAIFDAIMFALYGGCSGDSEKSKNGRNNFEEWRNDRAGSDTDTYVSFTFSVHGRKYRFERRLKQSRINLTPKYTAVEIDESGNEIPLFENPRKDDLTKKSEELTGLTKEQFRQVVLLPQGQFEKFLVASSGEKEDILKKVFGCEKWGEYADRFYANAKKKKDELESVKADILTLLSEDGCEEPDGLLELIDKAEKDRSEIIKKHEEFEGQAKRNQLDAEMLLSGRFDALHDLEKKQKALDEKKEQINEKRKKYYEAQEAESLWPFVDEYEKAERALGDRQKQYDELIGNLPEMVKQQEEAKIKYEECLKNSPVDGLNIKQGEYLSKKELYEKYDRLNDELKNAEKEYLSAEAGLKKSLTIYEALVREAASRMAEYNNLDDETKECRKRYFSGIYGEIACGLEDGKNCPVCGSTIHPNLAAKADDSVSREDVELKEKQAENAKNAWNESEEKRKTAEKEKDEKQSTFSKMKVERDSIAASLENARGSLIEGIYSLELLEKEIEKTASDIEDYNKLSGQLKNATDEAEKVLTNFQAQIENADKELLDADSAVKKARELLDDALRKSGYKDYLSVKNNLCSADTIAAMLSEIVEYDTGVQQTAEDIKQKQSELSGVSEPDAGSFEERAKQIENESEEYNKSITQLDTEINRLKKKHENVSEKYKKFSSGINQAESDLAFARKLRGDTGIGLQRYVLAVMFSQIIGEANRMLEKVKGGRFRLYRTDDSGQGNKRGLELKVYDNQGGKEGRSVSLLSGGQKFLVSLALSIGISEVAQKAGVQIEALFIDEGFGTLDDTCVNDAMDVLESIRKSSGMIGIISHVKLLESTINTHLEVIETKKNGSAVRIV